MLEMSSYMLERLATLRFDAAAMLNLSPDHLDRHGDMAGYAAAKRAIFDRQAAGIWRWSGWTTRPRATWPRRCGAAPARVVTVSGPAVLGRDGLPDHETAAGTEELLPPPPSAMRSATPRALPGAHNAQNAAAATAMARFFGVPDATIAHALASFPGLPHRQQRVAEIDGIVFINDSKATNANSAARALGCHDRIVWIAGGMQKEGGIEPLAEYFPRIARALLIGRDAAGLRRHPRRATTCRMTSSARWTPPFPPPWPPRATPARRWCCCRPPAPAGTSSPATTSAATASPNWRAA